MSYTDERTANMRLIILRELQYTAGFCGNDSVLQMVLDKWAHKVSRDRVRTELAWLADQGLITLTQLSESGSMRVTLTERGLDVAAGAITVPGVQRRGPGR